MRGYREACVAIGGMCGNMVVCVVGGSVGMVKVLYVCIVVYVRLRLMIICVWQIIHTHFGVTHM